MHAACVHFEDLISKNPGIIKLLSHYLEMRPTLKRGQIQQISGLAHILPEFSVNSTFSHPSGKGQDLVTEISKGGMLCPAQEGKPLRWKEHGPVLGMPQEETCRSSHSETFANKSVAAQGFI